MAARKKGLIQDAAGGQDKTLYKEWLRQQAGVESAADLDLPELRRVLNVLSPSPLVGEGRGDEGMDARGRATQGAVAEGAGRRATVGPEKQALVNKIHAQLGSAGRSPKYADAMARRMFRVAMFEWCTPDQLRRLVAALEYDRRRHS